MVRPLVWMALALTVFAAEVKDCACDPARAESMEAHACSLCAEAEKQPAGIPFFFLKDNSPHKPNRWLLLPRSHKTDGPLPLSKMSGAERTAFWSAAIERARSLWGADWGIALNGDGVRTQCHTHVHLGRLLDGAESGKPLVVTGPAEIPAPADGSGLWIHPSGGQLHVHLGGQRAEMVLMR